MHNDPGDMAQEVGMTSDVPTEGDPVNDRGEVLLPPMPSIVTKQKKMIPKAKALGSFSF